MKVELVNGKSPIGETIRAVVAAESPRYFKSEVNNTDRTFLVAGIILSQVNLALHDLGLSFADLLDIDPTDILSEQMRKDGYDLGGEGGNNA